jgi:NTP pyrophosphatase (non-canonical NTP hydrolase)
MDFQKLIDRAVEIRKRYSELELKKYGKTWTKEQIVQGFVGDVGDLVKLIMAKEGVRDIEDAENKLKHELSDCLWAILVIANKYNIDIEKSFMETMDHIEEKISSEK